MAGRRYVLIQSAAEHAQRFAGKGGYEGESMYAVDSGWPMDRPQRPIDECRPMVMRDCPEHVAPGGVLVSSHSTRRDLMRRNGWVDWEPINTGSFAKRGDGGRPCFGRKGAGFVSESFAKKRGRKTSAAAQEWMANAKREKFRKAGLAT